MSAGVASIEFKDVSWSGVESSLKEFCRVEWR